MIGVFFSPWHRQTRVRFFGRILKWICDLRSFGSWCIKGTDESLSVVDSSVPFMHHDPTDDLRSQIRFRILPKKRTLSLNDLSIQTSFIVGSSYNPILVSGNSCWEDFHFSMPVYASLTGKKIHLSFIHQA